MSAYVRRPLVAVFGALMAIVVVILAVVYFAPVAGSASTGITSTGSVLNSELPFIALMIVGGIAILAIEGKK